MTAYCTLLNTDGSSWKQNTEAKDNRISHAEIHALCIFLKIPIKSDIQMKSQIINGLNSRKGCKAIFIQIEAFPCQNCHTFFIECSKACPIVVHATDWVYIDEHPDIKIGQKAYFKTKFEQPKEKGQKKFSVLISYNSGAVSYHEMLLTSVCKTFKDVFNLTVPAHCGW